MTVTRRDFFEGLAAGTVLLTLQACGGDSGSDSGPGFGAGCSATSISINHGHTLTASTADLSSTSSKPYNIQGTADHDCSVTLTAAQLKDLLDGKSVSATSTLTTSVANGAREHIVSAKC
jgi:acetolactate synthase regulatory subunit